MNATIRRDSLLGLMAQVIDLRNQLRTAEANLDGALAAATDPGEPEQEPDNRPPWADSRPWSGAPPTSAFLDAIRDLGGVAGTVEVTEKVYGNADRALLKRTHSRLHALQGKRKLRRDEHRRWVLPPSR